jgi:copper oxidase (laccase) domain-containing protein
VWEVATTTGRVRVLASTRDDGDFNLDVVPPAVLEARRRALVDLPWTLLDERHGIDVVHVARPGGGDREVGDVAVTALAGTVVGAWVGDCAPVALVSSDGVIAAVHAGWRGLAAGVLDVAVDAVERVAGGTISAYLGPAIGACCYEFGEPDLARVAAGVGGDRSSVASTTRWGTVALDVPRAVAQALARRGVELTAASSCTGCDPSYYSHRARGERGRHVLAVWKEAA